MEIKLLDFEIKKIDYRKLKPIQGNLKDLSRKNYDRLKKSFQDKGMFLPIFVWEDRGEYKILDGHGRERLFSKEKANFVTEDGKKTRDVPCLIIPADNLKDAKEKLLVISSQYQTITQEGFEEFTVDLDGEWIKETTYFDALFKDNVKVLNPGNTDPDEIPEAPKEPKSRPGDLYVLGNHRLLCGDSTVSTDVEKLFDGVSPELMVTDPPYGVKYDPTWRDVRKGSKPKMRGKVANDDQVDWGGGVRSFPRECRLRVARGDIRWTSRAITPTTSIRNPIPDNLGKAALHARAGELSLEARAVLVRRQERLQRPLGWGPEAVNTLGDRFFRFIGEEFGGRKDGARHPKASRVHGPSDSKPFE